jgi:hypothetical protein
VETREPDDVGDPAERIERCETSVVEPHRVHEHQTVAFAQHGHVAAEPDGHGARHPHGPGHEERFG